MEIKKNASWTTKKGTKITQVLSKRGNVYLIETRDKKILVDTGHKSMSSILFKTLDGLHVNNLDALVLSHAHYDHIGNAAAIVKRYGCKVYVHEGAAELVSQGKNAKVEGTKTTIRLMMLFMGSFLLRKMLSEPVKSSFLITDRYRFEDRSSNIYTLHSPGHTTGSISLVIDDEIAVVGDALNGASKSSVMPILAIDPVLVKQSWKKLLDSGASLFLSGHGTPITRDRVRKELNI